MIEVVLVVERIVVILVLLHGLALNVAVESVIVLVAGYVMVELVLLY